ncbi:MAG: helix-hairpin-helix domain-containing protein [Desulfobacterales bacterium]
MKNNRGQPPGIITEKIRGIVDRITYHNPDTGWSVLRVLSFNNLHQQETVIVHQTKVFAGATMEFHGSWTVHPKFGRQFRAAEAFERKPATAAALEKYLGSGLIRGVGPKTAKKIVTYFGDKTLDIFEGEIERLEEVRGIAQKKLQMISDAWTAHRAIRDVMMFLQSHGISTLFAVRIYKEYGDNAIPYVTQDPYRLASDFFGIGFFSADKVALSIGLASDSPQRIIAGIKHVLSASREFGHCYLTRSQIRSQVRELIQLDLKDRLPDLLTQMVQDGLVMVRELVTPDGSAEPCYYSKSLYFDELYVAKKIAAMRTPPQVDSERINRWLDPFLSNSSS